MSKLIRISAIQPNKDCQSYLETQYFIRSGNTELAIPRCFKRFGQRNYLSFKLYQD